MFRNIADVIRSYAARAESRFFTHGDALLMALGVAAGVNLAIMALEMAFVGWEASSFRRVFVRPSKSAITDVVLFLLVQSSLAGLIGSFLTFGVITIFTSAIRHSLAPWQLKLALNPFVYYFVYLLFIDFFNYWNHRAFHQIGFLWEIHKLHHAATEMTVLTATRDHPIERIFGTMFVVLPVALLAPPTNEVFWLTLVVAAIGPLKHSDLEWDWSWFGRYIVQSPRAHWIHHSLEPRHFNKNFASIFSFWDHIFGTWYEPETQRPAFGVADAQFNREGTWMDMLECYKASGQTMWSALKGKSKNADVRVPIYSWLADGKSLSPKSSDSPIPEHEKRS